MANTKVTDLTEVTTVASGDFLYVVDVSDTTDSSAGSSRKITQTNLVAAGFETTSLGVTGLTVSELIRTNAGGTALESSGKTVPTGDIIGTTDTQTLTNKVLTATTNSFTAASVTQAGVSEIATATETDTGTDATRAVSPDGLQGSLRNLRFFLITLVASDTSVTANTTIEGDWPMPITGTIVQSDTDVDYFAAYTDTAGVTGTMVVDVHLNGTTIMDTNKLDIETGEKDTTTATTQPDLSTTGITKGDILTFDIDTNHSGTAAKGLKVMVAIRPD